jgi:hypothetical protein
MPQVSDQRLNDFKRNGFLIVPSLFTPEDIRRHAASIDALAARPPEVGKQMAYFENSLLVPGTRVLSRIERFVEYAPGLATLVRDSRIVDLTSALLGEPAVLFKDKINFKMPGGGGFTPHQDIQPGWDTYASYFISVLIAIDANTLENGCLELAAGQHGRGLIGRKWEPLEGAELDGVVFKPYPMEPGDAAFFDCFTPHQSQPNLTDRQRRNIYLTFNRQSEGDFREQYFADKRKSYPPDFERDPNQAYVFRV